jgi:hypothetical protein
MNLEEAMACMMTCATAEKCAREEACFVVAQWARERWRQDRSAVDVAPAPVPDNAITDYAPQWEASVGLPAIDWDAA